MPRLALMSKMAGSLWLQATRKPQQQKKKGYSETNLGRLAEIFTVVMLIMVIIDNIILILI